MSTNGGVGGREVLVINGPNLNLLGFREPAAYGTQTYSALEQLVAETGTSLGLETRCVQSNHEGQIIDWLHAARETAAGIVLNPAAYTHTSIGIRDAVLALEIPVVEVHISNIHSRESFRDRSFVAEVADAIVIGAGFYSYVMGLQFIAHRLETTHS
jgi:3-dehydroquinate dehydratase-2